MVRLTRPANSDRWGRIPTRRSACSEAVRGFSSAWSGSIKMCSEGDKWGQAYLFPQSVRIHYFCIGPISVDPICPQPIMCVWGCLPFRETRRPARPVPGEARADLTRANRLGHALPLPRRRRRLSRHRLIAHFDQARRLYQGFQGYGLSIIRIRYLVCSSNVVRVCFSCLAILRIEGCLNSTL